MTVLERPTNRDLRRRLDQARDLMETGYDRPLDLAQLAAAAHFSKFHFLRTFSEAFHRTPLQYLTEVRISHVKYLLRHTEITVTDICFSLGFESLGSFSSLFRRYTGESPSAYRLRHRRVFSLAIKEPAVLVPTCFLEMFVASPNLAIFEKRAKIETAIVIPGTQITGGNE